MFLARLASLQPLRRFVERFCARTAVRNDDCLRLNLVLEELFTNTVRHGHGADTDSPVWVSLALGEEALFVTYEDAAPAFNPYGIEELAPERTGTLERRRIGGLGLILARRLVTPLDYGYLFGRNQLRLALALHRGA